MNKTKRIESIFEIFRVIIAVLVAYIISLVIVALISDSPLEVIRLFLVGPFERISRIGDMITLAIPLTFTGLCMCFMYAVNKFNLIGEGIFIFSGCIITLAAVSMGDGVPKPLMIPILLIIGAVCGAVMGGIPALLDVKFGANVVVVSLMLNYILFYFTQYVMKNVIPNNSSSINETLPLPNSSKLSDIIPSAGIHWGLVIAFVCVVFVAFMFYKTPFGIKIRTVGSNPNFARFAGIGVSSTIVLAQVVGGIFAGLGGTVEIIGNYTSFRWVAMTNHGFDGLMVAVLAHRNPALVPVGALLLAYIRKGADIVNIQTNIAPEFVNIIQGIIILLIAAEMFLSSIKRGMIFRSAKKELKREVDRQ